MLDTLIIGAGQAGISVGYYLKKLNKNFIILDRNSKIGESWKDRYDSLLLFTPRMYSSLPGMDMDGDKNGFPTKDDVASYLKNYVKKFNLPIELGIEVISAYKQKNYFLVKTNQKEYMVKKLVIASGPFHTPYIPSFSSELSKGIYQIHSSQYKHPKQLAEGKVLVVGGGNSGAQIAVELSKEKETYLSHSTKLMYLPLVFIKKSIFWWFDKIGILKVNTNSRLGEFIQRKGDPIFGYDLKHAIKQKKIIKKGRVMDIKDNHITFKNQSSLRVENIIWATGFKNPMPWLKMNEIYNEEGQIIHQRGVTKVKGLYFIGLPWQYRRGSSLLQGVGYDAKYIVEHINNYSS
ncbi:NAD(P)/FAD-dependent oxidoreductase [Niallia taxi]|nr:NAD(P)/FAD-dependent oxidoreductase [Niallia taxi]MDE5055135.1 NAD(P)/FAD-dependent oxidoreductase [Niallia taxi]